MGAENGKGNDVSAESPTSVLEDEVCLDILYLFFFVPTRVLIHCGLKGVDVFSLLMFNR